MYACAAYLAVQSLEHIVNFHWLFKVIWAETNFKMNIFMTNLWVSGSAELQRDS